MSKNNKKKKPKVQHALFNSKRFLAPGSIRSMAAIHTKILADGTAIVRISDCNNSTRIWNDFNSSEEKKEMLEKVENLISHLKLFKQEIKERITI